MGVTGSRRAKKFEDLDVYQESLKLQQEIFHFSKKWPIEERYSLIDQIRRSSRSVGANLAECWAKRRYLPHFTSKLTDSDGELSETKHWLLTAKLCGYLDDENYNALVNQAKSIGRSIGSMIRNAEKWVQKAPKTETQVD